MLRGGIADKLGNRYEAKWVVLWLIKVLSGKADSLLFESIDTAFHGFEFVVEHTGVAHWHQTKMSSPGGNWSVNALHTAGVLQAFADRLVHENTRCHFVSQDNARDFYDLCRKSRIANDKKEFLGALSQRQKIAFGQLTAIWSVDDDQAFGWLQRSYCETISETALEGQNESFGDLYFVDGGTMVFAVLRDLAEEHFNKRLTTSCVRDLIKAGGALKIMEWTLDPTIQMRLKDKTEEYLGTYTPFGAGGETVTRKETADIIAELADPQGRTLVLLTGVAGSGKSGIVRAIIENLRETEIPHFAFRVDHFLQCTSREELGLQLLGRPEGPASTLKGTYPRQRSVLIIDQVDAVSEVSGRDGRVREVVFRLIADAHNFGGVKVIVVCRTFDLQSDPRLKNLLDLKQTKEVEASPFSWTDDIEPILKRNDVVVSKFNSQQRRLLELPVNLAIFLEIGEKEPTFTSRSSLHEKLIEKKENKIAKTLKPGWSVVQALTTMSEWMSKKQELAAPVAVLDQFPNAVNILSSEGLIISSHGRLNYFHESFFDHLYARAFIFKDETVLDMLLQKEQTLFRRTQVRQILDALRQNDFDRYVEELSALVFEPQVRFHIKLAICQWLNSVEDPTEREFTIMVKLDGRDDASTKLFQHTTMSDINWFDILYSKTWIAHQLNGREARIDVVLWWLSTIASERPSQIAGLLRKWWNGDVGRADRLVTWCGFLNRPASHPAILQLCLDVIRSDPADMLLEDGRNRISMLVHSLEGRDSELGGEILEALFDASVALHADEIPFERDGGLLAHHFLDSLPKKSPLAFLRGTTKAFLTSVKQVLSEGRSGPHWYYFQHRTASGHRSGVDQFVASYVEALRRLAAVNHVAAGGYLDRLPPFLHECFMHVHLELIAAHPEFFARRLLELANNELVFEAGFVGADWLSLAHACRAAFPHLDVETQALVEQAIMRRNMEIEEAVEQLHDYRDSGEQLPPQIRARIMRDLNNSGHQKWRILETVGKELLSPTASRELLMLRRKFSGRRIAGPLSTEIHKVGSPISGEKAQRMSDSQWLSAIHRYKDDDERTRGPGFVNGGARQLASELKDVAKISPTRFAALISKIPTDANRAYVKQILWGLVEADNVPVETIAYAIRLAHRITERPYGDEIARLVRQHPEVWSHEDIPAVLIWYALHGQADEREVIQQDNLAKETVTIDNLIQGGGGLYVRGINGVRGSAWEALSAILWQTTELNELAWAAIDHALVNEDLISVRCCMMRVLLPLFNSDKDRFGGAVQALVGLSAGSPVQTHPGRLAPLITHSGVHVFPYIHNSLPSVARRLLDALLESGDRTKELIAAWFIFGRSFEDEQLVAEASTLAELSIDHRRLMAAVAGNVLSWTDQVARAEDILREGFVDKDHQVRTQAADVFRHLKSDEVERHVQLIDVFLRSPAFAEHGYGVLHLMGEATCDILDLTILAAEMTIADIEMNGDRGSRRGMDLDRIQDLLKAEYNLSERSPTSRKRILDLIDLMLATGLSGVDSVVTAHDRW